jgi:hypothetical protein
MHHNRAGRWPALPGRPLDERKMTSNNPLVSMDFAWQSKRMETNQAAEHLQVIRTLMERAALYRRALAPVMIFSGVMGLAGGGVGWQLHIDSARGFVLFWAGMAAAVLTGSLLLVRRQALKDAEPFWSPPTRRVAQAMLPPLVVGLALGALVFGVWSGSNVPAAKTGNLDAERLIWLPAVWAVLYGCAIHSAGFFTPRGLRLLGWLFVVLGFGVFSGIASGEILHLPWWFGHLLMGVFFGALHLGYGGYLYLTRKESGTA